MLFLFKPLLGMTGNWYLAGSGHWKVKSKDGLEPSVLIDCLSNGMVANLLSAGRSMDAAESARKDGTGDDGVSYCGGPGR